MLLIASFPVIGQAGHPPEASPTVSAGMPEGWIGTWSGANRINGKGPNRPPDGRVLENPYDTLEQFVVTDLQPWAKAEHDAEDWTVEDTGALCKLDGIFRAGSEGSGGFVFMQTPEKLIQITGGVEEYGIRRIYPNSPHPPNLKLTWDGDSRSHWEGNTFVVDTIGFNDKSWLGSDRLVHSERLHVIEQYHLLDGGSYMELRVIVDDREALKAPYTYTRYYKKMPEGTEIGEHICNQYPHGRLVWQRQRDAAIQMYDQDFAIYVKQASSKDTEPSTTVTH